MYLMTNEGGELAQVGAELDGASPVRTLVHPQGAHRIDAG